MRSNRIVHIFNTKTGQSIRLKINLVLKDIACSPRTWIGKIDQEVKQVGMFCFHLRKYFMLFHGPFTNVCCNLGFLYSSCFTLTPKNIFCFHRTASSSSFSFFFFFILFFFFFFDKFFFY